MHRLCLPGWQLVTNPKCDVMRMHKPHRISGVALDICVSVRLCQPHVARRIEAGAVIAHRSYFNQLIFDR